MSSENQSGDFPDNGCSRCLGHGELTRDIRDCWMCDGTGDTRENNHDL
jgi:DnaJ-class molecular chaperone